MKLTGNIFLKTRLKLIGKELFNKKTCDKTVGN